MAQDNILKGTEVKYKVNLTATGFDMDSCDFFFTVYAGGRSLTILKSECIYDGENWYLCFDTSGLNPGLMTVATTAFIPDTDFQDGLRSEVNYSTLGVLKNE